MSDRTFRDAVLRMGRSGLDWRTFASRTVPRIARRVGADTWCLATCDPSTLVMTGVVMDRDASPDPRFFQLEYGAADYLSQQALARGAPHVGVLSRATEGRLDRSVRWRELIAPFGLGDQLRAALVSRRGCWGYLALMREGSRPWFEEADARLVSQLTPSLAEGLRLAHLAQEASTGGPEAPAGLVMLSDDLTVSGATSSADELLGDAVRVGGSPPAAVLAVASRVRAAAADGAVASARVQVRGRWVSLLATSLHGGTLREGIAVIIHAPHAPGVVDVMLAAWDLTRREAEIVRLALAGSSTDEIGAGLHLSTLTVQQHLKSIFDKVGVRTRRELVARIFEQHYLPAITSPDDAGDRP